MQLPFALERVRARARGRRRVEPSCGSLDLDVVEAHDRVDRDVARVGLLAHDLAVDLALRRHVDHDVRRDDAPCSRAGGPRRGRGRPRSAARSRVDRRQVACARGDPVLRELALGDARPGSARRSRGRRRPSRCRRRAAARRRAPSSRREPAAPARRREDDERRRRRSRLALRGRPPAPALDRPPRPRARSTRRRRRRARRRRRWARIQRAQSWSLPISTSAAMHRLDAPRHGAGS